MQDGVGMAAVYACLHWGLVCGVQAGRQESILQRVTHVAPATAWAWAANASAMLKVQQALTRCMLRAGCTAGRA